MIGHSRLGVSDSIEKLEFNFYPDENIVDISNWDGNIVHDPLIKKENLLKIISDKPKFLIHGGIGIFHLYHDILGNILRIINKFDSPHFIILLSDHAFPKYEIKEYRFILDYLDNNSISYNIISDQSIKYIFADNIYISSFPLFGINNPPKIVYDSIKKYLKLNDTVPTRKVYVSRRNYSKLEKEYSIGDKAIKDNRVQNEQELENYLSNLGFEIVLPETIDTFENQIKLFYETKTLIAVSSSGLANALFMQDKTTVVELVTPLVAESEIMHNDTVISLSEEMLHHFYHTIAFQRNQYYHAIQNNNRDGLSIINAIENNPGLKSLIGS